MRAVGLQHIALDTGFDIAGAVPKEAYQEDTAMYRADRLQDNHEWTSNTNKDVDYASVVGGLCSRVESDSVFE